MLTGETVKWRAAAAGDADRAATTTEQFVTRTRHAGVREALAILRGAHSFVRYPATARRADALAVLVASVETQARVSGCGRVTIPVSGWFRHTEEALAQANAGRDLLCPECENGKPVNCVGEALDVSTDSFVPCATTGGA